MSAPDRQFVAKSYQCDGLAALRGDLRPGRPRKHSDDKIAELPRIVLQGKPEVANRGTIRSAAAQSGIS
jgi:hypothetical protein